MLAIALEVNHVSIPDRDSREFRLADCFYSGGSSGGVSIPDRDSREFRPSTRAMAGKSIVSIPDRDSREFRLKYFEELPLPLRFNP